MEKDRKNLNQKQAAEITKQKLEKEKRNQYLGVAGLLLVTIIWGGGFVASDTALDIMPPFQVLTIRFFLASLFMFFLCYPKLKKLPKQEIKAGIILGFFLFAAFALQTIGLNYTTPSKNAFLTATNVVLVPFIALIASRKKVAKQSVLGAVMALTGAGILSLEKNLSLGFGDALTLLCAICFAFQIFLTGEYVGKYRATVINFLQMLTAFLLSALCLLFEIGFLGGTIVWNMGIVGLGSVLYLGIIGTTVTYLLQTVSQKYVEETKAAIVLSMEAVFGSLFSIWLRGDQMSLRMGIGCCLILGAVFLSEREPKEKNESIQNR